MASPEVQPTRDYHFSDTTVLMIADVVVDNFNELKLEIIEKRPTWVDPFITNFDNQVDACYNILGINRKVAQKHARFLRTTKQEDILEKMVSFKVLFEEDFKSSPGFRNATLTDLGFTTNWNEAHRNKSNRYLISLLFAFSQNMTNQLETKINNNGMTPGLIQEILDYTDVYEQLAKTQQHEKSSSKVLVGSDIVLFNDMYAVLSSICNICKNIFVHDKVKQQMFSMKHIQESFEHLRVSIPPPPAPPV